MTPPSLFVILQTTSRNRQARAPGVSARTHAHSAFVSPSLCPFKLTQSHAHTHLLTEERKKKEKRGQRRITGRINASGLPKKKKKNEKRGATVTPLLQGKDFYRDEEPCSAALRWQMFNACSCRSCTLSVDVELQWINWSE